jgi:zinc protease
MGSKYYHQYIVRLLEGEPSMPPFTDSDSADASSSVSTQGQEGASNSAPTDEAAGTSSLGSTDRPPWPHEASDIPLDPNVRVGELPNGLRYMVLKNAEPPGMLQLRLHVDAGSLQESDGQEGIAHYLEHMAYQSLRNFPGIDTTQLLRELGLEALSGHSNAYTTFDETVYWLALPNLENETVSTCFKVMRGYADGMLFVEDELETERGVVLSELQDADSVADQIWRTRWLPWALPDNLLPQRWPIGLEESINNFTRQDFLDFYQKFYSAQHITFIAVGDMNTTDLEDLISKHFGSMVDEPSRIAPTDFGPIPVGAGLRAAVFFDDELQVDELTIQGFKPADVKPDSVARRVESMKMTVCNDILGKRFQSLSSNATSPIEWGGAYTDPWFNIVEFNNIFVHPTGGRWQEAVAVIEQELRRAITFGFLPQEVEQVKAEILNIFEGEVLSKGTRDNDAMADYLLFSINGNYVASTPEEDLRIAAIALGGITPGMWLM